MQRLIEGIHTFRAGRFLNSHGLLNRASRDGRQSETLLITCADARLLAERISLNPDGFYCDSIETVVGCQGFDGFVAIGGCDKNMPAAMIAIAGLNRPAVFVYGGTVLPGCITGDPQQRKLDIVSVFEALGQHAAGKIDDRELKAVERCAIPGAGSCGGMYTANTMAKTLGAVTDEDLHP